MKGTTGSAIGDFLVREAKVISLGEAMWMFGNAYTAVEIYQYFCNCRRLSTKRPHAWTNAERREAILQHKGETGRWGLGKGSAIGEIVWEGKVSVDSCKVDVRLSSYILNFLGGRVGWLGLLLELFVY